MGCYTFYFIWWNFLNKKFLSPYGKYAKSNDNNVAILLNMQELVA